MIPFVFEFVLNLLTILQFFVFLGVIFSWFPQSGKHPFVQFVFRVIAPIFRLFPRVQIGMLDLTPLLVLLSLQILTSLATHFFQKIASSLAFSASLNMIV